MKQLTGLYRRLHCRTTVYRSGRLLPKAVDGGLTVDLWWHCM